MKYVFRINLIGFSDSPIYSVFESYEQCFDFLKKYYFNKNANADVRQVIIEMLGEVKQ